MNLVVFTTVVVLVLVANIAVGMVRRRTTITFSVYQADPDKHRWHVLAMTLTGTIVGGGMFLGVGQIGYEAGVTGYFLGVIYLVGLLMVAALAKRARAMLDQGNHKSIIDLLDANYSGDVVLQFCLVSLIMYLFLLAGQFVALIQFARFVTAKSTHTFLPWALVMFAGLSLFFYPIIGGLRKDIQTDIFQVLIILLASFVVLVRLFRTGIRDAVFENLTPDHLTGTAYGVVFILGAILFLTPSFFVRMDIWQRIRTARTTSHATWGFIIAAIASCFFYFFFTTIGMWAFSSGVPGGIYASLELIYTQFSNPLALGLIIGAFFAAVLSSADTFINNTSIFAARLFLKDAWKNSRDQAGETRLLLWSRLFAIILTLVSIILALLSPNLVDLLVGAFSILLLFLPTVCGLFVAGWRHSTAALWSTRVGLVIFGILFFVWNPKLAFAPAVLAAGISYAIIRALVHQQQQARQVEDTRGVT